MRVECINPTECSEACTSEVMSIVWKTIKTDLAAAREELNVSDRSRAVIIVADAERIARAWLQ